MTDITKNVTRAQWDRAGPGSRVLDVAAGAGEQTLMIARRVGPTGSVLATDLSPAILALAEDNAQDAGLSNVQFQIADGEDLQVQPASFDAVVCRLGLMLFGDPMSGLGEMHKALKPDGHICTMVFSQPEHNPCITILMKTALQHAGLPPTNPYTPGGLLSLGRPGLIDELFAAAGFRNVATTQINAPFRMPSAKAYLDFVRSSASPIQQILGRLDEPYRERAWAEMEEELSIYTTPWGWEGPNELLLTAGRR